VTTSECLHFHCTPQLYPQATLPSDQSRFRYLLPNQAFIGAVQPIIYTPTLAQPLQMLGQQLSLLQGLPEVARETAILTTSTLYRSPYIQYAHTVLAKNAGLTDAQIALIKEGVRPKSLDDASSITYDITIEIHNRNFPLSEELWLEGVRALGREGVLSLLHYIGHFSHLSIVLNGCGIEAPSV